MRKLGIIAGAGNLPAKIIKECQKQKRPFFVLALQGHAEPDLIPDNIECEWVRVGDIKKSIDICKAAGVQDVLMIGAVKRPSFWELRPDWYGIKFLLKIGWKALGDDGLLKAVIGRIEELGFKVIGADDILTDSVNEGCRKCGKLCFHEIKSKRKQKSGLGGKKVVAGVFVRRKHIVFIPCMGRYRPARF